MSSRKKATLIPPASRWQMAGSGVSFDAGDVRVRLEAAGSIEQRKAIAKLCATSPRLLESIKTYLRKADDPAGFSIPDLEACIADFKAAVAEAETT